MKMPQMSMFRGLTSEEAARIVASACGRRAVFEKNEVVFHMGDRTHEMGLVMEGSVNVESADLWGNKSILSNVAAGQVFAETYALCGEPLMVDVVAAQRVEIFFLDLGRLLDEKNAAQAWYPKVMKDMLSVAMRKNLTLSSRIFCTAAKTARGRILTYLSEQAVKNGATEFNIPFDRQQMADYLNLDRSALSKELGRMRDEGMLDFHKNRFCLKGADEWQRYSGGSA